MQVVRRRCLGDGVVAVRRKEAILGCPGGVRAVFRRTARVHVRHDSLRCRRQFRYQPLRQGQVCLVYPVTLALERIRTIGNAVEDRAGADRRQDGIKVRLDQQVGHTHLFGRHSIQTPRRQPPCRAGDILADRPDPVHQICPDEPARPQDQDWPLQSGDLRPRIPGGHGASPTPGSGPRPSLPTPPGLGMPTRPGWL